MLQSLLSNNKKSKQSSKNLSFQNSCNFFFGIRKKIGSVERRREVSSSVRVTISQLVCVVNKVALTCFTAFKRIL